MAHSAGDDAGRVLQLGRSQSAGSAQPGAGQVSRCCSLHVTVKPRVETTQKEDQVASATAIIHCTLHIEHTCLMPSWILLATMYKSLSTCICPAEAMDSRVGTTSSTLCTSSKARTMSSGRGVCWTHLGDGGRGAWLAAASSC